MARRNQVVKKITNGVINTTIDLLLFQVALIGSSVGKPRSPQGVTRMFEETFSALGRVNHHTIRSAWNTLRRQGLIDYVDDRLYYRPVITALGKKRLSETVSTYKKIRPWDRRLYIITYDIPESKKSKRDLIREFLKIMGAASIQQSVWLTPYNPRQLIDEFIKEHGIFGTIIISDTGTNGTVGEETIEDLIARVYRLEELNDEYEFFLSSYKDKSSQEAIFDYLAILAEDPQLPFKLLPDWWKGEEAYEAYKYLKRKIKEENRLEG